MSEEKEEKARNTGLRNIILISQISISILVPTFLLLAVGLWLDNKFGTWFTIPLFILGLAAGLRNAYVLALSTFKKEDGKRKKEKEAEIEAKVARYNKEHGGGIE